MRVQTLFEEKLNAATHAIGALFGVAALILLIVFYAIQKIPFNHVIWHLFVLSGAIFHFFMIFFYVI